MEMWPRNSVCAASEQCVLILETSFSRTEVARLPLETGFKVTVTINVSSWVWLGTNLTMVKGWPELSMSEDAPQFKPIFPQSFFNIYI